MSRGKTLYSGVFILWPGVDSRFETEPGHARDRKLRAADRLNKTGFSDL
jgi:hypothetical protein